MFWSRLFYRLVHSFKVKRQVRHWDGAWTKGQAAAAWQHDVPRAQVCAAVDSGFIPAKSRILEIGCGTGTTAAWLAKQGMTVVAVDISPAAVSRAREMHGPIPGLEFRVLDVCEPAGAPGEFDVFLDTACFHAIKPSLLKWYADNLSRWARPGARLMILSLLIGHSFDGRDRQVRGLFSRDFEIMSAAPAEIRPLRIGVGAGFEVEKVDERGNLAGAEFHLVRRGSAA
jgi:cyclopropane fatty-acyl-phospholipid synthase-like methyltransferase